MDRQPDHRRDEAIWTSSFIVLTLCFLLLFLCLQLLLSPFPSYVKEQYHPGDLVVSLVTSLIAVSAIIARVVTVPLMKRVSRTRILYGGIVLAAISTVSYSLVDSVAGLLLLRVLFGFGFGVASSVLPTLVTQIIPENRMGEGIGYFGLSTTIAMCAGPLIGLTVLEEFGFAALSLLGTVTVLMIIPLLQAVKPIFLTRPTKTETVPTSEDSSGVSLRTRRFIVPALLHFMMSSSYGGVLSFLALFGKESGIAKVGLFFLFASVAIVAVRPISGRLYDRKGHEPVLIPASLLVAGSLWLLSISTSVPLLIGSALLYGLGFGAIQPTLQAWMLKESHPRERGAINSLFYNTLDLGVALGSMLLGAIASASSYAVMYRFSAGLMVIFLICYLVWGRKAMVAAR
ncbi:MFS transporter [Cohnella sp.]|uniref:MFS transporter n=1 Tax=Cohnella sp. TaxID=1883426 RepID=UPI00356A06D1